MQWSRVKTVLIILLLLVNGFLAAMLGGKAWFVYQRAQEARQHVETILAKRQITLADTAEVQTSVLMPQLRADRSRTAEAAFASALLGAEASRREDGEESYFESEYGEVVWNAQGFVRARLTPKDYKRPADTEVYARTLLEGAGLQAEYWSAHGSRITAAARLAGYAVFGQEITVTCTAEGVEIDGRWVFEKPYAIKSNFYTDCSAIDALIVFSEYAEGCQIAKIEPGLLLTDGAPKYLQITPGWRVDTDQGTFFIDPLKKAVY